MKTRVKGPVMLMILDGWGIAAPSETNAIHRARTPVMDALAASCPSTTLTASGAAVGLPEGQMGNSEVGHLNLGAGRLVYQDLTRITRAIEDGSFRRNPALREAMGAVKKGHASLHLMGLVSDGGVHSHMAHLFALVEMALDVGCCPVQIHALLDGRDTSPTSGLRYVSELEMFLQEQKAGRIATVMGRFWGMDRDLRWDRIQRAYEALSLGEGRRFTSARQAVQWAYAQGETDEFIQPSVIEAEGGTLPGLLRDGDAMVFFNFRADRAREISQALTDLAFGGFHRPRVPRLSAYVCMTQYDETFPLPVAFPPLRLDNILGEVLASEALRQLRIAETEKYAHVTFFFNGGEEKSMPLEDRCLIPSPKDVPTYDLKPEMSARGIAEEVIEMIQRRVYDVIVLNFANGDMVGHTGILSAAIQACETVDGCVGRVVSAVLEQEGVALITADHGNVEQMWDEKTQGPHTAHTTNPVPCILVGSTQGKVALREGILADVAPTLLEIMGQPVPGEMTGRSLLRRS